MPMTPEPGSTTFATTADLLALVDANLIGELVTDDGSRLTPDQVATNSIALMSLSVASGRVVTYLVAHTRYKKEDLQALTGDDRANLAAIVVGIALDVLFARRGRTNDHPVSREAAAQLQSLSEGATIFPFLEVEAAGLPTTQQLQSVDFFAQSSLVTNQVRQWGLRANRRGQPGTETGRGYVGF